MKNSLLIFIVLHAFVFPTGNVGHSLFKKADSKSAATVFLACHFAPTFPGIPGPLTPVFDVPLSAFMPLFLPASVSL